MDEHQRFAILRVESPGQVIMQLQPSASAYALKNSYGLFLRRSGKRSMKGDDEGAPENYFWSLAEPVVRHREIAIGNALKNVPRF